MNLDEIRNRILTDPEIGKCGGLYQVLEAMVSETQTLRAEVNYLREQEER